MSGPLTHDGATKLRAELDRRIESARAHLEHPQPEDWANIYRGEIRACRSLLEWLDPEAANAPARPEPEHMRITKPPTGY